MRALVSVLGRKLRPFALRASAPAFVSVALVACIIPELTTGSGDDEAAAATTSDGGTVDAGVVGGGCGQESTTGTNLCIATSMCPTVVVDTQAMPHCGFRIRGGVPELVCACGSALCSMGVFDTCTQAASLLTNQTEATVCAQISEGRCLEVTPPVRTPTNDAPASSSSSSSGGNSACDRQCVKDCGGGAACASVCNCN